MKILQALVILVLSLNIGSNVRADETDELIAAASANLPADVKKQIQESELVLAQINDLKQQIARAVQENTANSKASKHYFIASGSLLVLTVGGIYLNSKFNVSQGSFFLSGVNVALENLGMAIVGGTVTTGAGGLGTWYYFSIDNSKVADLENRLNDLKSHFENQIALLKSEQSIKAP